MRAQCATAPSRSPTAAPPLCRPTPPRRRLQLRLFFRRAGAIQRQRDPSLPVLLRGKPGYQRGGVVMYEADGQVEGVR